MLKRAGTFDHELEKTFVYNFYMSMKYIKHTSNNMRLKIGIIVLKLVI